MALSQNAENLRRFVVDYLQYLEHYGGSGTHLEFPTFELTPFHYIDFAEAEIQTNSTASRINCVAHLKRAVDCELDTFLHLLKLNKKRKKLSVGQKLDLIGKIGIFSSRSLDKLNKIRNKMEHEFAVPEIEDLETYFELVQAFVYALEGFIFMLSTCTEMDWMSSKNEGRFKGDLTVSYSFEEPKISYSLKQGETDTELEFTPNNIEDFAFALKVFFLLCRVISLVNWEYAVEKLKANRDEPNHKTH